MATAIQKVLEALRDQGGLEPRDIPNIVGVFPPIVVEWLSDKGTPDARTQIVMAELRYVIDRLAGFYRAYEIRRWLHAPQPMLDGLRAIDLITAGRTADVLNVIECLDSGAYT